MIWDRIWQFVRRSRASRRAERLKNALPVVMDFGGGSGVTHNVSLSGVFLDTDIAYSVDSTVHFTIDLSTLGGADLLPAAGAERRTPAGAMSMECSGTVIRVEKLGDKFGIAVKLHSQRLKENPPRGR